MKKKFQSGLLHKFKRISSTLNNSLNLTDIDLKFENSHVSSYKQILEPSCTADEYFHHVSHFIELSGIYRVLENCYYNDQMKYCPVLLEVAAEKVRAQFEEKQFLLQVWTQSEGKVFERPLARRPSVIAVTYQYFIYLMKATPEEPTSIHVIDLENQNLEIKVLNFILDFEQVKYLSFMNDQLYCALDYTLKIAKIGPEWFKEGQITEVDMSSNKLKFRSSKLQTKIHGLPVDERSNEEEYQIVILETRDNQLDFNSVTVEDFESDDFHSFQFQQLAHTAKRDQIHAKDPISSVLISISKGLMYNVALRKSSGFDIYYNMQIKDSIYVEATDPGNNEIDGSEYQTDQTVVDTSRVFINKLQEKVKERQNLKGIAKVKPAQGLKAVSASLTCLYFLMNNNECQIITHQGQEVRGFSQAQRVEESDFNFKQVHLKRVKNIVQLYSSFQVVQEDSKIVAYVAHGRFLSVLDSNSNNVWANHVEFPSEITGLFKHDMGPIRKQKELSHEKDSDYDSEEDDEDYDIEQQQNFKHCLICADGSIIFDYPSILDQDIESVSQDKVDLTVQGKIINFHSDPSSTALYITHRCPTVRNEKEGEQEKDHEYEIEFTALYRGRLIPLDKKVPDKDEDATLIPIQITRINNEGKQQNTNYVLIQISRKITVYQVEKERNKISLEDSIPYFTLKGQQGTLKYACTFKLNDCLFLMDSKDMHVITFLDNGKDPKFFCFKDIVCIGLLSFDKQYTYMICKESPETKMPGIRVFDMEDVEKKLRLAYKGEIDVKSGATLSTQNSNQTKEDAIVSRFQLNLVHIRKIYIGQPEYFNYDADLGRFCFLNLLQQIIICPVFQDNTMKFLGIKDPDAYVCWKVFDQELVTLDTQGRLQSWSLLTGKPLRELSFPDLDLDSYQNLSKFREGHVVLRSNESVEGQNDEDLLEQGEIKPLVDNQILFKEQEQQGQNEYKRYRILEIESTERIVIKLEFVQLSYPDEMLYVSDDCERLLRQLSLDRAEYFEIKDKISSDKPYVQFTCDWSLLKSINDLPDELQFDKQSLETFSPCLRKYIVLDNMGRCLIIKDTLTGKSEYFIPKKLMKSNKLEPSPLSMINRIRWIDQTHLQMINEEGFEKIVNIESEQFQQVGFNYRPLFTDLDSSQLANQPYYQRRGEFPNRLRRLQRIYQDYKTEYYLEDISKQNQQKENEAVLAEKRAQSLNSVLFRVVSQTAFTEVEHSFSLLDWILIERLYNMTLKIEEVEEKELKTIVYTILPGGTTILHKLVGNISKAQNTQQAKPSAQDKAGELFIDYHVNRAQQIITIFKKFHTEEQILLSIPILPNFTGSTVFSLLLDMDGFSVVDEILRYLSLYPICYHSRELAPHLPKLVEYQLSSLIQYLESRFQQTKQLRRIEKLQLKEDPEEMFSCDLWFMKKDIQDRLSTKEWVPETTVKLEFLDLPGIYHFNDKHFKKFFANLAETNQLEFFNNRAIRALVDFNYPIVKRYIVLSIVLPFISFHVLFVIYMNAIYENRNDSIHYQRVNVIFAILLLGFSVFFICMEVAQFYKQGWRYVKSFWNYIDFIAPLGVIINQIIQLIDFQQALNGSDWRVDESFNRVVLTLSTFFMWVKLMQNLRIFKSTGYLIRMIVEVIHDMGIFLFILLITLLGFGDSFLRLSLGNSDESDQFIGAGGPGTGNGNFVMAALYVYNMILGNFDTTSFGQIDVPLVWILFLLCTIIDMIVMLNLLITIISDTYARISENAEQAAYIEMAQLIAENSYLVPASTKSTYAQQDKFLVFVTNLDIQEREQKDQVQVKLDRMQENLDQMKDKVQTCIDTQNQQALELANLRPQLLQRLEMIMNHVYSKMWTVIHKHHLCKATLGEIRLQTGKYKSSFGCDGRHYHYCETGQRRGEKKQIDQKNETLYWCPTCNFCYCFECYKYFKDAHNHPLKKIQEGELPQELQDEGWSCAIANFKGCRQDERQNEDYWKNPETPVYHCFKCDFDLCETCADDYKISKAVPEPKPYKNPVRSLKE